GAELRPKEHLDGVSLVPLLHGESMPERPLIWHYPHYGNQGGEPSAVIRLGDWKLIHYYEDSRKELYNLKTDSEEQFNVAEDRPEMVQELKLILFQMLEEMGAHFPVRDPQYSAEEEMQHLEWVIHNRWPQLEKQRMEFLSKDYDPGNNWWGSMITKD
ncbi:MAG: DUF4976 domain-containing protein, partial [Bacteroidota bacterium]|nr:DUF4976 domain-containing protein [Bacteroidota bacterium]